MGYEEVYEASTHGRIRSLDRINHRGARIKGRILKPGWDGRYLVVTLCKDGVSQARRVHLVVAEAFLGEKPLHLVTCHYDGDSRNNHLDNLRFDTPEANMADQIRHGRLNQPRRTHCKRGHELTPENSHWSTLRRGDKTTERRTCLICLKTVHRARKVAI